ncbi:MAG: butyrate kinase [Chloroflexota bacterium]
MHWARDMNDFKLLIINPGSTSTKIAVFQDERSLFQTTLRHSVEDLEVFSRIVHQFQYRYNAVQEVLNQEGHDAARFDAFVGRGGLLGPISGGTYLVSRAMLQELEEERYGSHASNLGALIAHRFAEAHGTPAFVVDPVTVDEMEEVARISGLPEIPRVSIFHALNQKAVARRAASEMGKRYDDAHLIVAHLGGGISVGAHRRGKVIEVNNAIAGDGPFSPERAGVLPSGQLVDLCFSGYTRDEIMRKLVGQGGLVAHLGTNSAEEVERRIAASDEKAGLVYDAMAYQIAKAIGACATVLKGKVDAIVITGGLAHSSRLAEKIRTSVEFIAPVKIHAGEEEMLALAEGALRVLRREEEPKIYEPAL